jgi:hypothetical protein
MNFGILDFDSIEKGSNAISTIHETLAMAQYVEELDFTKYWLSEYHEDGMAWKKYKRLYGFIKRILYKKI